jgi:hypothetical protein
MVYTATTHRGLLGFLLAIIVSSTIRYDSFADGIFYIQLLLAVFILVAIFIKFKIYMEDDYLTYQIVFFTKTIYQKTVYPNQINQIKFIRLGWKGKGAILQLKKGFNIRVVNFVPSNILNDLTQFANKNGILISQTKDYLNME